MDIRNYNSYLPLSSFVTSIILIWAAVLVFPSQAKANLRNNSSITHQKTNTTQDTELQPPADDYYENNFIRFGDFVYENNIKTVLFNRKGWEFSSPIIEINSDDMLELSFDDLDADFKNYAYTIIHCNALWQPSDLMEYEYIEGFSIDRITHYSFSRNTRVPFTHYQFEFPNANIQPKLTGNYILKIFHENNPERIVLTRRFMVYEQQVSIEASVKQATNLNHRETSQEVDFTINTSLYPISNPFRDLRVLVTQNGRWDNAIYDLKPKLVQGSRLIYDYEDGNLFPGGNEFRNFDTKSLRYRSLQVGEIHSLTNGWEVVLIPDRSRRYMRYTTRSDIDGRFLVKTDDYTDDRLEADYTWVQFSLLHDRPLVNGNVYVMGGLTDWNLIPSNKMEYNYRDARYELRLLLKQGFYDYQYVFLEDGTDVADVSIFEGSHSVAGNYYTIYTYYRKPGDIFDSLIGIQHVIYGN
jgi:hypothetical protein